MRKLLLFGLVLISVDGFAAEIDEYVYSRGDRGQIIHMNDFSLGNLGKMPKGHYFWFRDEGRSYVIRDASTLLVIDRIFEDAQRLAPETEALRKRMRPLERRESEIDDALDRIDEEIDALEEKEERDRIRDLRLRERPLRDELRTVTAELRELERKESELDRRNDALEREAERKLVPVVQEAVRRGVAVKGELY